MVADLFCFNPVESGLMFLPGKGKDGDDGLQKSFNPVESGLMFLPVCVKRLVCQRAIRCFNPVESGLMFLPNFFSNLGVPAIVCFNPVESGLMFLP